MHSELIAGFPTKSEAEHARDVLLDRGIVARSQVRVAPAANFGNLRTRSEAPQGTLLGLVLGALLGGAVAVLLSFAAVDIPVFELVGLLAGIGAGVGAFIGAVAGMTFKQPEDLDATEPLAHYGFILRIEVDEPEQERRATKVLDESHAAMLSREEPTAAAQP